MGNALAAFLRSTAVSISRLSIRASAGGNLGLAVSCAPIPLKNGRPALWKASAGLHSATRILNRVASFAAPPSHHNGSVCENHALNAPSELLTKRQFEVNSSGDELGA